MRREIFIEIKTFSFMKLHLKMLSAKVAAILSWSQYVSTSFLPLEKNTEKKWLMVLFTQRFPACWNCPVLVCL